MKMLPRPMWRPQPAARAAGSCRRWVPLKIGALRYGTLADCATMPRKNGTSDLVGFSPHCPVRYRGGRPGGRPGPGPEADRTWVARRPPTCASASGPCQAAMWQVLYSSTCTHHHPPARSAPSGHVVGYAVVTEWPKRRRFFGS